MTDPVDLAAHDVPHDTVATPATSKLSAVSHPNIPALLGAAVVAGLAALGAYHPSTDQVSVLSLVEVFLIGAATIFTSKK